MEPAKHNKADTHTVDLKKSTQGGEEKGNEDFSMRYRYTMEHGFTVIHKWRTRHPSKTDEKKRLNLFREGTQRPTCDSSLSILGFQDGSKTSIPN